jgi:predicted transcriptional regulator
MAALGESSAMARNTMERMRSSTNAVTQKEAIRQAMGVTDSSDALSKVIDDLAGYGQVINTATDITKEGLATMRTKMEELEKLASEVRSDTQKAYAVNSDTLTKTASPKATAAPKSNDPFAKLIHQ